MPVPKHEYISDVWKEGIFGMSCGRTLNPTILIYGIENKVVFCTGGAGTICSAQVRALVYLGANACIVGRNVEKTEQMAQDIATVRKGAKVLGIGAVDVRIMDRLQEAADRCVKELGGIDFVMYESHPQAVILSSTDGYSAGAAGNFLAPITQLSANAFKSVIDIDVLGSYNTVKATLPYLIKSAAKNKSDGNSCMFSFCLCILIETVPNAHCLFLGSTGSAGGRIIFVSATIHYTGLPLQTHVSVAKAGVDALSNAVAIEMGPRGVTSNVIAPGPIAGTEGTERLAVKEVIKNPGSRVPIGRFGTVRDVADATIYLFSSAGDFVNGGTIVGKGVFFDSF